MLIGKKFFIRTAVVACSVAFVAVGIFSGTASANPDAGWVGWGQLNNTHAVWCVQKLIDDSPAPAYTPTDGAFGSDTERAIKIFQGWAGIKPQDGIVGPVTGNSLLNSFYDYYDGYCYTYLPTTY